MLKLWLELHVLVLVLLITSRLHHPANQCLTAGTTKVTVAHVSAAEYFQISDLSISYTEPHLALDFTAVVARTLRQRPWFTIHMTRPPYHRDVCEDTGKPCAYEMCDITAPSARLSDDRDICRLDEGRYNISVTLPAPPLIDPREPTRNVYTYTLEFFEQNMPVGCQTFVFDALLLKEKDEVGRDTATEAVNVVTAPTAPTLTENSTSS
ncbi:uncharacterized protein [Dermacentor albipictus]|uniref:uncharacterized protein n=1 Tax=Dermacentor albipictus TaxID=60249 RepID=UPI0031FDE759